MLLGVPMASVHLILVGAFAVAFAQALLRRDPLWMLALGLPLLVCADRAGLSGTLVAWACALYVAGAALYLVATILRAVGGGAALALLAAAAVLGLSAGTADARYADLSAASLHHPPLLGVRIEGWLDLFTRP